MKRHEQVRTVATPADRGGRRIERSRRGDEIDVAFAAAFDRMEVGWDEHDQLVTL